MKLRAVATWAAIVVPIWIVMILCTHWEPVQRDGWGHYLWHEHTGLSWHDLIGFARGTYTHNNPRLGQVVTLLMFTPGPWHVMFTPLLELGTFYLLVALVLGRWPHTVDDAQVFLVAIAIIAVTAPQFGVMLFYRPYTGNYVFGLFVNLLFLIPYRYKRGFWPVMLVIGFASGLCNEHTGPAVLGLAAVATFATWKREHRVYVWQLAGLVAMAAGGLALYLAPGQNIRYNGIAQQSLSEMLGERGIGGNLEVIGSLFMYMAPALAWIAVAQIRRSRTPVEKEQRWTEVALVAAALAIAFTLLVSPKTGPRLYFGSCALAAVVIANIAMRQRMRMVLVAGSALVMAFVAWKCVTGYRVIGQTWAKRVAEGKRDQPIDYTPYPLPKTRWYLDDDMTLEQYRTLAAAALQSSIMPP